MSTLTLMWNLLLTVLFRVEESAIPVRPTMKTVGPGVVTEQWFAGDGCIDEDTIMKIYIDGETTPSLDLNLFMAHEIGRHSVPGDQM